MAYVAHQRKLMRILEDGRTYRDHLLSAARNPIAAAAARAELADPELPEVCLEVWIWFAELNASRSYHAHGPNPISYTEISAWMSVTRRSPAPWELGLLRAMDQLWLAGPEETAHGHQRPAQPQAAGG